MIKKLIRLLKIEFIYFIDNVIIFVQRLRVRNYFFALRIKKISGELIKTDEIQKLVIFIVFEKN